MCKFILIINMYLVFEYVYKKKYVLFLGLFENFEINYFSYVFMKFDSIWLFKVIVLLIRIFVYLIVFCGKFY